LVQTFKEYYGLDLTVREAVILVLKWDGLRKYNIEIGSGAVIQAKLHRKGLKICWGGI
jgi:hypothetical protein